MILKEMDALKKHCPFSFAGDVHAISTYCLGTECMAWRWIPDGKAEKDREGYCGMTRRPECR